ncbi:hypothetical protein [uncultured Lamprocystis sp.]|uniref:hypothetical protein n=1 Tax=uncultured Lamprocystis sp. TaxID=543132 RepID=UPI0025EA0381|nr:hypothetical protein [uncultured Lamprocystis sp.]
MDKARRTMFGIQHVGCARPIHHGPQRTLKFGIAEAGTRALIVIPAGGVRSQGFQP